MQHITNVKNKLRTGVEVGKWRAQALKLGYERTTGERERKRLVTALGTVAWERRVEHPEYADLFAQLTQLQQQRTDCQAAIAAVESEIKQAEAHKGQVEREAASRIQASEERKRGLTKRLAQQENPSTGGRSQPAASAATTRRMEGAEAQGAELAPAPSVAQGGALTEGDRQALQAELTEIEQEIRTIAAERQQTCAKIDEQLAQLRQDLKDKRSQLAGLERQFSALQQSFGEQVDRLRPQHNDLIEHYAHLDATDQNLARLTHDIDTLNQQIAAAGKGATQSLYWLAGGAVATVLLLVVLLSGVLGSFGGGGGVSEAQIRKDLIGQELEGGYDTTWPIEEALLKKLQVAERKTDLEAGTDYIMANLELADKVLAVRASVEFEYKRYEQGWKLEAMRQPEKWSDIGWTGYVDQLVLLRDPPNAPNIDRIQADIEAFAKEQSMFGRCRNGVSLNIANTYGGNSNGSNSIVYEAYGTVCGMEETWIGTYRWNGTQWEVENFHCRQGGLCWPM